MTSRRRRAPLLAVTAALVAAVGCPGPREDDDAAGDDDTFSYPRDDELRLNHLQALGTHNSYHVQTPGVEVAAWAYTHLPLDEQLGQQGVRQFELDVYRDADSGAFEVYHVPLLDETTTCRALVDCLSAMKGWSDDHPAHHPLYTLLEVKDPFDAEAAPEFLDALEAAVTSVWPEDRLVTPDLVRGDASCLRDALAEEGWPTLGTLRGRALFVLHDGGGWRDAYTDGGTTSAGRLLFPDAYGDLDLPYAAVHSINDPQASAALIAEVVAAGHLVRTRADADGEGVAEGDTSRRDAALASGAHFVSTDHPQPDAASGYVVAIPGGTPSRCNPSTAPDGCTSEDIEDPRFIDP